MSLRERLIWWAGVNLGLVLTPLFFNAFSSSGVGWQRAIEHGELMLVAVAVAGVAVVSAIEAKPPTARWREVRAALIVGGLTFILTAGLLYADAFRAIADQRDVSVIGESYVVLPLAVLIGAIGVALSHRSDLESA